jgi:hypothetical protein
VIRHSWYQSSSRTEYSKSFTLFTNKILTHKSIVLNLRVFLA